MKSIINCSGQVLGFTGESQFSSLPFFLGWWVLPACHPSLTIIDPTHLLHVSKPNQHTASSLLHKCFSQITCVRRRAPFLASPSAPGQTAQQKLRLDKAWLIFNSAVRSTVKGGWVQPLKECGLVLNAQKQLKHPPLSRVLPRATYRLGMRRGRQHLHTENWSELIIFLLENHSASARLRVYACCLGLQPISSITILMI